MVISVELTSRFPVTYFQR